MNYLTWFVLIVIIIVILLLIVAFTPCLKVGQNRTGDVVIENRVIDNNRIRRNLGDLESENLSTGSDVETNDSLFPDEDFEELGGQPEGNLLSAKEKNKLKKIRAANEAAIAANKKISANFELFDNSAITPTASILPASGVQGPEGRCGRVDIAIIPYSGVFTGLSAIGAAGADDNSNSKYAVIGFGAASKKRLECDTLVANANEAEDENKEKKMGWEHSTIKHHERELARYRFKSDEEQQEAERENARLLMEEENAAQLVGSFWVNPTARKIRLSTLRGAGISNNLSALPGTLLYLQILLAASGSTKFVPIGSKVEIGLNSTSKLISFGSSAVELDIEVEPGTMVALSASTSTHVRGDIHIGAGLSYY